MIIKLENFANISSIEYEIDNSKVNFLLGISGAGKSSIAKSLFVSDITQYTKAGKSALECNAEIIDSPAENIDDIAIYNYDYMSDVLLIKSHTKDMYNLLFSDCDRMKLFKAQYEILVGKLFLTKDKIQKVFDQIRLLVKSLNLKFIKDGREYSANCSVNKFQKSILAKSGGVLAKKYNVKRVQWFIEGKNTEDFEHDKCPFCGRKLSESRLEIINKITNIDSKSYEKIRGVISSLDELHIIEPNWNSKRSTDAFKKQLHDYYEIIEELNHVLSVINAANVSDFNADTISHIKLSKVTKKYFPDLSNDVKNYNQELSSVKIAFNKLNSESKKVLKRNLLTLNTYLKRFNVPYEIINVGTDRSEELSGYYLAHKDESNDCDRTDWLSYGEKNLVGLILFILINTDKHLLIIDDPASSFDSNRRKAILDLIFEKKSSNSTILILSHDEVFVKIANYFSSSSRKKLLSNACLSTTERKYAKEMGKTTFIESNETHSLVEINDDDFGSFANFVNSRLNSLNKEINLQTAILLRMLFEGKNKNDKRNRIVYGYLSAIIHRCNYENITDSLTNEGFTEKMVLDVINSLTGGKYKPLSKDYLKSIFDYNYTDFEMMALCREELIGTKDIYLKTILSEMNAIIHQSATYITCLNPFKFKLYSQDTYSYIDGFRKSFSQQLIESAK